MEEDNIMSFIIENGILKEYISEEKASSLVIPKEVTKIEESVFENHTEITEVEFSEGIVEIAKNAFRFTGIEKVKIPDSVISIGENAFLCRKPGLYAWETADCYAELKVSKKNKVYYTDGKSLLKHNQDGTDTLVLCFKKGLINYNVPQNVSIISSNAFCYCTKLQTVSLPDTRIMICDDAFANTKVGELKVPASVEYLGNNPHRWYEAGKYRRNELVKIIPDADNTRFFVENDCLYERDADGTITLISFETPKSKTVAINNETNVIGNYAFRSANIDSIVFPKSVIRIENGAFENCKFKGISIPEGVKYVGENAFSYCSKLKKISLPATLEDVAFTIVDNDCNVELNENNPYLKMIDGIIYDNSLTTVKLVTNTAAKKICIIPDSVSVIGNAFAEKNLSNSKQFCG